MTSQILLNPMDIMLNDIIFEEVQKAGQYDTDIEIYNRLAQYYTIEDLDHCVKVFNLIHKNQALKQRLLA